MYRLFLAICILSVSFLVAAQDRATLNGTVTDSSGALVEGARVELLSAATGLHRESLTNQHGIYEFPSLPVGSYRKAACTISSPAEAVHRCTMSTNHPRA